MLRIAAFFLLACTLSAQIEPNTGLRKQDPAAVARAKKENAKMAKKWNICRKRLDSAGYVKPDTDPAQYLNKCVPAGEMEAVKIVIECGCMPKWTSHPIYLAIVNGRDDMAKMMIKASGKLFSKEGTSHPMIAAIDKENAKMVKILLAAGSPPDQEVLHDKYGLITPREYAEKEGTDEIKTLFNAVPAKERKRWQDVPTF